MLGLATNYLPFESPQIIEQGSDPRVVPVPQYVSTPQSSNLVYSFITMND
jgi:hypothetical protein